MRLRYFDKNKRRANARQRAADETGFTLIETVIALIIVTIAIVGVASVSLYASKYNSGASDRAIAIAVAQQQMERLRNVPFTDASLTAATTTTTVTSAGYAYTVVLTITDTTPTLKTINVQVTPQRPSSKWAQSPVVLITQRAALTPGPYIG